MMSQTNLTILIYSVRQAVCMVNTANKPVLSGQDGGLFLYYTCDILSYKSIKLNRR